MARRPSKARRPNRSKSKTEVGQSLGFRSGLEVRVAAELEKAIGKPVPYETLTIPYNKPARTSKYTPDFQLPNGIIVETKGRFLTADRQKHLLIKAQHPGLDIRFVFNDPNRTISKISSTTYAAWCDKYSFKYAKNSVPFAWIAEGTS